MKLINHFILITLVLFGLSLQYSCNSANANAEDKKQEVQQIEVPTLITRGDAIQYGEEWENIQNAYSLNKDRVSKDASNQKSMLNLSHIFINEARITGEHGHYYPAALKMLDGILNQPTVEKDMRFSALSAKAGVLLSLHQFPEALATAQEAVKLNTYNAQIYGALVDAHVELGNYDEAVKMSDKMVSVRPDLRSYSRVSYLREIHGDVKGAIQAMEMAVEAGFPAYEQTSWARLTLGELQETYGDLKAAEMHYKIILQNRKDYPFAVGALARLEMKKGNYAEAERLYKEAAAIIPEVGFYTELAELYKKQGRTEEMEALIKEVWPMLEDDVKNGHIMNLEYAAIYSDLVEDQDKALSYAMVEYEQRPKNVDVNLVLADIYHKKGNMEKAKEHLAKASTTKSASPELLALAKELK